MKTIVISLVTLLLLNGLFAQPRAVPLDRPSADAITGGTGGNGCTPTAYTKAKIETGPEECKKCEDYAHSHYSRKCDKSGTDDGCVDFEEEEGTTECGTCIEFCGGTMKDYYQRND